DTISKEKARKIFSDNRFKLELIEGIEDDNVSIYKQGEFVDLCKGPHLVSTGIVKSFKLLSVAGSYWRGDENRESLQRIYGISYPKKELLDNYIKSYEEAKKRDHRKIGKKMDLFNIYEEVGSGLIIWHPKGAIIREIIEDYWKKKHIQNGYQLVKTPHIAKIDLWKISGHMDYYRNNMFTFQVDDEEYVVKPMNCPYHILIFNSKIRSYRDLPIRYAELGTVYRNELSGVLHGMLRVRGFTQDDAHIFCREDQISEETGKTVDFALQIIKTFDYKDFEVHLSTHDPESKEDYAGSEGEWKKAEDLLVKVLREKELEYTIEQGEAVFYGPKIDIFIKDALGRKWQGPTIQFDFNLPNRFKMKYIGEDGKEHPVYMIHRALFGSLERFVGGLIEHYNGNFPLWLAPVQIRILTITHDVNEFAEKVYNKCKEDDFRVELDVRNEKLSKKIRDAEHQKIPYQFIIGKREVDTGNISVRHHLNGDIGNYKIKDFLLQLREEVKTRR
ncbi:MAG: threonine--tRNA ligase, partial [Acidobacteriota bacterium]|nr:threonine--tRNA ligase [Acidobacteriota bacterium]